MTGKIIKGIAGFYYVHIIGQGIYECRAKGIFRKMGIKPLVGDNVEVEVISEEDKTGNVVSIQDRKSTLIRPAVANVDQAITIFAVKSPEPNLNLLDRFLVMMEYQKVPVVICFNKGDLTDDDYLSELKEIYSFTDYDILFTSAKTLEGQEELKMRLKGKTTVLAGPSGVGKSSIINTLQSDVLMETGEISKKLNRGKHTTRHSEIVPISDNDNSYIIDTPGFSAVDIPDFSKEDLSSCFTEFDKVSDKCRFAGCSHISEPDCEVKRLLSEGKLSKVRYDNYVKLYSELSC